MGKKTTGRTGGGQAAGESSSGSTKMRS
jgi:hypothetical protein